MRTTPYNYPLERRRSRGAGATRSARRQRDACLECSAEQEPFCSHVSSVFSALLQRYARPQHCTGHYQSYQSCVAKTTTRAVWRARLQLSAWRALLVSLQPLARRPQGRDSSPEQALRCTRHRCIKRRKLVDGNLKELSCHRSQKAITRPRHSRVHSDARRCTASLSCYLIAAI